MRSPDPRNYESDRDYYDALDKYTEWLHRDMEDEIDRYEEKKAGKWDEDYYD